MQPSFDPLNEEKLCEIETRLQKVSAGPWLSFVEGRDHESGSSFIRTPSNDIELSGASPADQDFIAHAREDIPALIREVRKLWDAKK